MHAVSDNPEEQAQQAPVRDEKGRFPKGVSGNPGGRPKGVKSALEHAKSILEEDQARARRIAEKWLRRLENEAPVQDLAMLFERQDGKVPNRNLNAEVDAADLVLRDRTKADPRLPPNVEEMEKAEEEPE